MIFYRESLPGRNMNNIKNINYKYILWIALATLLLFWLPFFIIDTVNIASITNKNIFTYTVKVRNSVEEMDKIFERAEVNINVLADSISNSYNSSRQQDKSYNLQYIKDIDGLVKSVLTNSPGIDGSWFQLNADLPYSAQAYNWYQFRNDQFINLRDQLEDGPSANRKITPESDPYYFDAINSQGTTWSDIYIDPDTNVAMMTISTPIYKDGVLVGVVGVDISTATLQETLKNMQFTLGDSEIYLLDRKNKVIVSQLLNNSNIQNSNYSFLNLLKDNEDGQIEYYDKLTKKTAIILTLSNKYKLVISFKDKTLFGGINTLFKTIYFLFIALVATTIIALMTRVKIIITNKKLKNETRKLRTIIDSSPNIILIKNLQGVYTDCNSKILDILGVSKENFIGKTDYDLFDKGEVVENTKNDNIAIITKKELNVESYYTNKAREKLHIEKHIIPLLDSHEKMVGLLIIGIDITKRTEV